MTVEKAKKVYSDYVKKIRAFDYFEFLTGWDSQTEAPKNSVNMEAIAKGIFSDMEYGLRTAAQFKEAVNVLYESRNELDDVLSHEVEVQHKKTEQMSRIPREEFLKYSELMSKGYSIWLEAKTKSDFSIFAPILTEIVEYKRKLTEWLETDDMKGYDVLLDMYEPGLTKADCDLFFGTVKDKLVPLIKQISELDDKTDYSFARKAYPKDKQREFCEYLRDVMCFDKTRGLMMESEHPFTTNFGTDDIRITNHYYVNDFTDAIFSAIHETGHSIYEQQVDPSLNWTLSGGGASMAMHESQSRFYENMIGRSLGFWKVHYPKLQYVFPEQLEDVSLELFMKYINRSEISFIRTQADELTYPLHVMVRYDVEKALIEDGYPVEKLPELWNRKFEEYFGVVPPDDRRGVLQDAHWSYGDFGYFPTYALGSAYAAQFYHEMTSEFDVDGSLADGTTARINSWLKEKIHKFGASKYPKDIIRYATGEDFDPHYYTDYLVDKYSRVYGLGE
ncbi:MAG: carboxypeptidase M32 [Oscillospiraceae bacterium]